MLESRLGIGIIPNLSVHCCILRYPQQQKAALFPESSSRENKVHLPMKCAKDYKRDQDFRKTQMSTPGKRQTILLEWEVETSALRALAMPRLQRILGICDAQQEAGHRTLTSSLSLTSSDLFICEAVRC